MKIIDIYNDKKIKYNNYVIIIRSGIFYEVLNDDTSILYNLLGYKIKNNGNNFIIGFPNNSLSKVCTTLEHNKINYVVFDKDEEGNFFELDKFKSSKNKYHEFLMDLNKLQYINYKIENIYKKLNEKVKDDDIEKILFNIEELL